MVIRSFLMIVPFFLTSAAFATGAAITYQGRIILPDGTALNSGNVQFRIQVRTPDLSNCLMYEETKTLSMTGSNGLFALPLNDIGASRTDTAAVYDFDRVFANKGTFTFPAGDCGPTNTYTPLTSAGRRIVGMFFMNGAWEALPSMSVNYVPYAIESTTVGGYGSGDLLRVDHLPSQVIAPFTFTDYGKLVDLASGKLNGSVLPSFSGGQVLGSDGAGGWTAVTPLTATDLPACATGEYLRVSSGALVCQTITMTNGTVTSITAGTGLTGGTITSTGTIALATVGSGGTGTKLSYDTYGRISGSASLAEADIPTLSASGKIAGSAISGTIGNGTSISTNGSIQTSTNVMAGRLYMYDGGGTNTVGFRAPASVTPYVLTYPAAQGSSGQILTNDGTGVLSWVSPLASVSGAASLANGKLWLGDATGKAQEMSISGDASLSSAGALTLNTVSVAKGGTGLTAAATNGQLLIGNGSGYTLGNITAGAGVSVVNTAGAITINATGSGGTVTNVTGTAPIAVANGASTPSISIAKSTAAVDGYLAAADFSTFNAKLGTASVFAGDVSGTSASMSVDKIKGSPLLLTTPASGQYLKYNGTYWINAVIDAADIGTGTLPAARMPAHTGDVTSSAGSTTLTLGTVATAKGGTGLTSIGTSNQILGVNTGATGLEYKTLTAGSGVTITPAAGTLTINAIGSGNVNSGTTNQLAYYSASGTAVGGLASANSSVLTTNGSSVPSWSTIASDIFTQYTLLAGRAGGQSLKGGTAASENLTLDSTSNATKGYVLIAPSGGNVGIGTTTPGAKLDVTGDAKISGAIQASAERVQGVVSSGTTLTLNPISSGSIYRVSLTGNATISLPSDPSVTNAMAEVVVVIKQDATGSRTLTWSPPGGDAIIWSGGTTPTVCASANQTTMYQFMKINGDTNWYAAQTWKQCP